MQLKTRAVLAAEQILAENPELVGPPVKVHQLARRHATIFHDRLAPDVSGLLVPPSVEAGNRWIIVVNKAHPLSRQKFTTAHELGHLLLHGYTTPHADGRNTVRYRNRSSSQGTDVEEIEANQFAAELLMPADLLIPRLEALGLTSWSEERSKSMASVLEDLALEYRVSEQAMLLRIGNLLQHG